MNFKGIIPHFQTDAVLKYFQNVSKIEEEVVRELSNQEAKVERNITNLAITTNECRNKILKEINFLDNLFDKEKAKRQFQSSKNSIYRCCSLKTFDEDEIKNHLKNHRNVRNTDKSSHFLTPFGNLFPVRFVINKLENQFEEGTKKKSIQKINQVDKTQKPFQKLKKEEQKGKKQKSVQRMDGCMFYCGCSEKFTFLQHFTRHIRSKHDFQIPEGSSHIIMRLNNTKKTTIPSFVDTGETYQCICSGKKKYKHKEFIQHVMKWHKGITPILKMDI